MTRPTNNMAATQPPLDLDEPPDLEQIARAIGYASLEEAVWCRYAFPEVSAHHRHLIPDFDAVARARLHAGSQRAARLFARRTQQENSE